MSILIKGMEMPKSCVDCQMMQDEWISCKLTGSWEWADEFNASKERLKDCPLVPVPPHGDLIDRDALPMSRVEWEDVVNAPTIIEAEEGET